MKSTLDTPRTVSRTASAALEEVADRRRRTIRLPEDREWLVELTKQPAKLLSQMAEKQLLYRVERGRYVLAPRGSFAVEQAAPAELLADLVIAHRSPYYVGFLSALISHRLTDLHSSDIYVAIPAEGKIRVSQQRMPGGVLHFTQFKGSRWPLLGSSEIERVRAFKDSKEFWWRSSVERTLIDALNRPELSGGMETVVSAWARARIERRANWLELARIAKRLGSSTQRRVAFLLKLLDVRGSGDWFGFSGRSSNVILDRSRSFQSTNRCPRDPETGILINVPQKTLEGWIGGAEVG